ncbi:hypothetical protein EDD16DRAFT_1522006 [Pisolithus croceorrhizus]|nr:hypothetical protein EDD16DRAFT_1522006 [Pisolithus croceorrhizus]
MSSRKCSKSNLHTKVEHVPTVGNERHAVTFLQEPMCAEHAQRVDMQTSVLLNQVIPVLIAMVPHLSTLKGQAKWQQHSKSTAQEHKPDHLNGLPPAHNIPMSPIPETEDVYDPATEDPQIDIPCPTELISTMADANTGMDGYESVSAEEFDIDMVFSCSDNDGSDLNSDLDDSLDSPVMKFLHHPKPAVWQAVTTQKHCPGRPKGSSSMPVTEPVMAADPEMSCLLLESSHITDYTSS